MTQTIQLKRAYDPASSDDGYRVFIDKLWPRGLSHDTFHYDFWDKAISPSTELREWFHQDPDSRWDSFKEKYKAELMKNPAFDALRKILADKQQVTLLFSSHDRIHNNAVVVQQMLDN
ncbi:MAG: DUF488 family protein [Muribaculaceae bacterium]|nr:DUF488 family protein [Muribaculaceae bacterium]